MGKHQMNRIYVAIACVLLGVYIGHRIEKTKSEAAMSAYKLVVAEERQKAQEEFNSKVSDYIRKVNETKEVSEEYEAKIGSLNSSLADIGRVYSGCKASLRAVRATPKNDSSSPAPSTGSDEKVGDSGGVEEGRVSALIAAGARDGIRLESLQDYVRKSCQ